MGKQIRFFQLESDIYDLLNFLSQHQLNIYDSVGNTVIQVDDLYREYLVSINEKHIASEDSLNSPIEYVVPCPVDTTQITEARFYISDSPNYEIQKTEDMMIIQEGRFYLPNEYYTNQKFVTIYSLLKRYIQKHYVYSPKQGSYFSQKCVEMYKTGDVHFAQGTNVYELTDI